MQYEFRTDIGKRRSVNEDSAAVYELQGGPVLAIIADGMGGHRGGELASSTAVQSIGEQFKSIENPHAMDEQSWSSWLEQVITHTNLSIYEMAEEDEQYKGMGTTLDAVIIFESSCIISHTGDSRVYKITETELQQITRDHSFVNALLDSGEITEEEAAVHPQRNWIMRAIGTEKTIELDFYSIHFEEGAYLLICTDGLSNKIENEKMKEVVMSEVSLSQKVEQLIDLANDMGGEDNITVILVGPFRSEVSQH
ncbi:Stp1/IreP family PP2C-type Ser/Thr phosphatase [Sporosarcina sp. Te-1]|uniref:Stp1/IreP family PP2C-type Ser/Thr phosphatase n=1 Tax=Sporosarcina sp. Te-1 TaxID=2818390 RepID=UPI001A9DB5FE|nr:Stp1/IreP family PP2C-type Ser/Thr phosphatase [Sporosarcina sp. Te-1]QTD42370.1 Stp1/IreP family PP2C-type Ser/Thr phosphatase [Sporosarcina sp. Te-1]